MSDNAKFSSLGYRGMGQVEGSRWIPAGIYSFRGGMSFPTRRFKGGGSRMEGCFIWSCFSEGKVYLIDVSVWTEICEADEFFSQNFFDGFKLRFFTAESDLDIWRNMLKFSLIDESRRPRPIYLDRIDDNKLLDVILRWMHLENLYYEKGSVFYKRLGLFLTNPNLEIDPFLEALGYLLIGLETFNRV